ncbi:MAG: hypothetical protein H7301_04360 [Cryobacterium sp.]|nr:hypothetical protein [Oligoflexia bacterium]
MPKLDPFTQKRLERFIEDFRRANGELPTLEELAKSGFDRSCVDAAVRQEVIVEFYVTLTNGVIKKGYKLFVKDPF